MTLIRGLTLFVCVLAFSSIPTQAMEKESVGVESTVGIEFENDYNPESLGIPNEGSDDDSSSSKQLTSSGKKLPQTGSQKSKLTVVAGIILMGLCVIMTRQKNKKKSIRERITNENHKIHEFKFN